MIDEWKEKLGIRPVKSLIRGHRDGNTHFLGLKEFQTLNA